MRRVSLVFALTGCLSAAFGQVNAPAPPPTVPFPGLPAQPPMRLTLADAERLAVQRNPRISASLLNAQAAGQVTNEERAGYYPTVFGSVTGVGADAGSRIAAGALNNPVVYNRVGTGVTVNQLITDFGRTRDLVASADLRARASSQAAVTTRADILLETARDYYAVLRAQSVLQVALQTVSARQLVSDQITALAQNKLKSNLDVSFANVNLADAQLLLARAQNDLNATQADLGTVLGTPGQTNFVLVDEPMPPSPPADLTPFLQQAIQQRPELADLRLEQEAAERFIQAERALAYPSIGAIGTAGFAPAGDPQIPGRYGAIGVNLNIPIFNGGLFRSRRNEAEYRAQEAAQNLRDTQNRVLRDVSVAYLTFQTAWQRVGLTAKLLDQASLALDLAQSRYDLGLGSIIEVSQAQLNLTSAQIANASAKYDYEAQKTVLDYEAGTLR